MPDEYDWQGAERSAAVYRCDEGDFISSVGWLERCKEATAICRRTELERFKRRSVTRTNRDGTVQVIPFLQRFPQLVSWGEQKSNEERWFRDWQVSSAGQFPMGHSWYLETFDYTDKDERCIGFIPQFVVEPRHVSCRNVEPQKLMQRLQRFDTTVKVPFGWFFYMVHGNRIRSEAGKIIAKGIRKGDLRLPINDEAVLMDWDEEPYGF
jgi:hypothetical protein